MAKIWRSDEEFEKAFGVKPHEVITDNPSVDKYSNDLAFIKNNFKKVK